MSRDDSPQQLNQNTDLTSDQNVEKYPDKVDEHPNELVSRGARASDILANIASNRRQRDQQTTPQVGTTTKLAREAVSIQRERRRSNQSSASLPVSSFDSAQDTDSSRARSNPIIWFCLGLGSALISQALSWFFFSASWAWGGALLFCVCALGGYIAPIFQRNADDIWLHRCTPLRANGRLALDLSSLFIGVLLGFSLGSITIGLEGYTAIFLGLDDQIATAGVSLLDGHFVSFGDLLANNFPVLLAVFLIGLVMRYLGILFVLIYNAALWGVLLPALSSTEESSIAAQVVVVLALLPHVCLEACAYVIAAMSGVFASRCLQQYRWGDAPFRRVVQSVYLLMATAGIILVVAAGCEFLLPQGTRSSNNPSDYRMMNFEPEADPDWVEDAVEVTE